MLIDTVCQVGKAEAGDGIGPGNLAGRSIVAECAGRKLAAHAAEMGPVVISGEYQPERAVRRTAWKKRTVRGANPRAVSSVYVR